MIRPNLPHRLSTMFRLAALCLGTKPTHHASTPSLMMWHFEKCLWGLHNLVIIPLGTSQFATRPRCRPMPPANFIEVALSSIRVLKYNPIISQYCSCILFLFVHFYNSLSLSLSLYDCQSRLREIKIPMKIVHYSNTEVYGLSLFQMFNFIPILQAP